jgi:hypothetical protein
MALAPRPLVIYCAYSSILTPQQSYTLYEVQDSVYSSVMKVMWFHKIVALEKNSEVSYGLTLA